MKLTVLIFGLLSLSIVFAKTQPIAANIDETAEFKFEYAVESASESRSIATEEESFKVEPASEADREVAGTEEEVEQQPKRELKYWEYSKED